MKSSKGYDNELTVSVRTGRGRTSIDLGLDHLTSPERDFIFSSVANTLKGGSAAFGMETLKDGKIVLIVTLEGSVPVKETTKGVKAALNGSKH